MEAGTLPIRPRVTTNHFLVPRPITAITTKTISSSNSPVVLPTIPVELWWEVFKWFRGADFMRLNLVAFT
jgi:hypothetical protein